MGAVHQSIHFASIGGCRVAWASAGSGPPLVVGGWWMSHLELDWQNLPFRRFVTALAAHRTVIRYDRPGTGLSDRDSPPPSDLAAEVEVLAGVTDAAVGADAVAVFGGSSGGPLAVAYAAGAPDRVERLILYGSYANGAAIAAPEVRSSVVSMVRANWGLGSRLLADVFMPDADADERARFAQFQRDSADAEAAARWLDTVYQFDVGDAPQHVRSPTLVLHRREDRAIPFALGRDLAARVPGAEFRPLTGREHFPWRGAADEVVRATLRFLDVPVDGRDPARSRPPSPAQGEGDARLTTRELDVLRLVARGLSDAAIAEALFVSAHTVHRHIANIRAKLHVPTRAAAAATAARLHLI